MTPLEKFFLYLALILSIAGAAMGYFGMHLGQANRDSGIQLTAWAGGPLVGWLNHVQECHAPPPHSPPPPGQCGQAPNDHVAPPPPPPVWE